jgi:hypothetical protein
MVDLEGSNRTGSLLLKHGHEFRDVVRLLEIYPLSKKHELRKVQSDDPEASYQEAVEDFSSQASHRVIVYFDLMKFFLIASKVPGPLKRRALQSLRTRLIKSEGTMSLVECQIHLRLLELAIENKVLIVSDPLYLRLGELSAEGGRLSFRIQSDRRADCLEKKNCEMKQFRFLYEGLKQELFEAGNLSKEIVWWLKRMR